MTGAPATVLVVDDSPENRYAIRRYLAAPEFDVLEAETGSEGLEMAARDPDLILLDVHLPDVAGDQVLKRLRADELTRAIPVIAVSADATEEQSRRMTALGAANYLTKPLTLNMVLGAVWDVLDRPLEAQSA